MNNINYLLRKYEKTISAERHTQNYQRQQKTDENRKNRHLLLDTLLNETPFTLTKTEIQQIRFWIDTFNTEWKSLHRQASDETIILALILIQRKQYNPKTQITRYSICRKYDLTNSKFITIQNRLIFLLMKTTPLTYTQSKYYDHYQQEKQGKNKGE